MCQSTIFNLFKVTRCLFIKNILRELAGVFLSFIKSVKLVKFVKKYGYCQDVTIW